MAGVSVVNVPRNIFKESESLDRFSCVECNSLLQNAVQLSCGHRVCRHCADELIANTETTPQCPECDEEISEEDGAKYFPDRFVKREILNLIVVCLFSNLGCKWEGKYEHYHQHIDSCQFATSTCQYCGETVHKSRAKSHTQSCTSIPKVCPLASLGCTKVAMVSDKLQQHMEEASSQHLRMIASHLERTVPSESMGLRGEHMMHAKLESMAAEMKKDLTRAIMSEMREEIAGLKTTVNKLEKMIRSKNTELEDRDFRLSLIENSNHDGSMIWKIPQFSQRKADAENGKYISIFSLPFYSGRYSYKICLCPNMVEMDEETVGLKTVTQKFGTESPFKILLPLATHWKTIGVLLGLKKDNLTKIQSEEQNVYDRLLEMLSQWSKHQIDPPPSWEALADAVKEVDPSIAKHIREKHPDKHELLPQL